MPRSKNFIEDEAEYLTDTEDDFNEIEIREHNIFADEIFVNLSRFMNTQFYKNKQLQTYMIEIGYEGSMLTYYCDERDWQTIYILLYPEDKKELKRNYTYYIQKKYPNFEFTD
jgi:hypothetical protein